MVAGVTKQEAGKNAGDRGLAQALGHLVGVELHLVDVTRLAHFASSPGDQPDLSRLSASASSVWLSAWSLRYA